MMMKWKFPPKAKIYEALGAVADQRVELLNDARARVMSSDGTKSYIVEWSDGGTKITSNDNASFYQGYTGYPIVATLMLLNQISYDSDVAAQMKGISWKTINKRYRNSYERALEHIFSDLAARGVSRDAVDHEVERIYDQLTKLDLEVLQKRLPPPPR